jgi:iron-sulfur cluster insertion protein
VSEFQDPLSFSDSAVAKVKILIEEEENQELKLRLYITGGGCAGFSYGFSFVEEVAEDDTVITKSEVSLVVDAMSLQYLAGSEVDYREGLQGSQFIVNNPNATTTCGCGSSFAL